MYVPCASPRRHRGWLSLLVGGLLLGCAADTSSENAANTQSVADTLTRQLTVTANGVEGLATTEGFPLSTNTGAAPQITTPTEQTFSAGSTSLLPITYVANAPTSSFEIRLQLSENATKQLLFSPLTTSAITTGSGSTETNLAITVPANICDDLPPIIVSTRLQTQVQVDTHISNTASTTVTLDCSTGIATN